MLPCVASGEPRTGHVPHALMLASHLTTSANRTRLNHRGIDGMTLRRRSPRRLATMAHLPASAWRRVARQHVARAYRRPRVLDQNIHLAGDDGPMRQLPGAALGHAEPPVLLTHQRRRAASTRIARDATRMGMAKSIAEGIAFFHRDAVSSAVARQISCDVQLTLMASRLSRLLGAQVGRGDTEAKSRPIFRDCIDAVGLMTLTDHEIIVPYQKRAHHPVLMAAGVANTDVAVPWLGDTRLRLVFGETVVVLRLFPNVGIQARSGKSLCRGERARARRSSNPAKNWTLDLPCLNERRSSMRCGCNL